jgi:hypothetical protein
MLEMGLITIKRKSIPGVVRLFLLIALLADSVAIICEAISRFLLHLGWPYNSPLLDEQRPVPDLVNYVPEFKHLHTAAFFNGPYPIPYMYPAPVAPLYGLFLNLTHPVRVFVATLILLLLLAAFLLCMHLLKKGLSVANSLLVSGGALILSYPAWYELKQGNMELFVCIVIGIGIWCILHDRFHAAAVCIGIAGAMKLFPFIYLGLFLSRRKYRPIITAVATATLVTIASLLYITPSLAFSWHGVQANLADYKQCVVLAVGRAIGYDHSLFAFIKIPLAHTRFNTLQDFAFYLNIYMAVIAVGGVLVYFFRIRNMPIINQILIFCVASVLVTPVSYDYTLLHLYIPWAILVFFALDHASNVIPGLKAAFIFFALATSAETELIVFHHTFGAEFKCIVLVLLAVIALRFPFRMPQELPVTNQTAF